MWPWVKAYVSKCQSIGNAGTWWPMGWLEVNVDFMLTKKLREHQRQGVQFLFDCLMGNRPFNGCGCILADDMGLGKTLQSVAIIWTLLTQGGPGGKSACRKALVVCPASLVKNWAAEFDKWLIPFCHESTRLTSVWPITCGCMAVKS